MFRQLLITLLYTAALTAGLSAQFLGGGLPKSDLQAVTNVTAVAPGDGFQVALTMELPAGYHSYYVNPGGVGKGLSVTWTLPEGLSNPPLRYPTPKRFTTPSGQENVVSYGYEKSVTFLFDFVAPTNAASGSNLSLSGTASWLMCDDSGCLPQRADFSVTVPIAEASVLNPDTESLFKKAAQNYPAPSTNWKFTIEADEDLFWLIVKAPEGVELTEPFHFFSANGEVDAQAEQAFDVDENGHTFYLDRNKGNDALGIKPGPAGDNLSGIFAYHLPDGTRQSIKVGADQLEQKAEPESVGTLVKASAAEREEGAALWDPETRPDYVLLDGSKEEKLTFFKALPLVFLGGLILNLMPCVFPVLGLKVMGFVQLGGSDPQKIRMHGLVFTLGLMVTMWILASIIIALGLNWGQQLSNPIFLGTIIVVLFLMGLNLYGLFEVGTSMTSVGGELQTKKGYSGSFWQGALTTLIATPCSGPFLGLVMGFALQQESKAVALAIFTVFGLGIASPYLVLSFLPNAIQKLPRPGAWMESFKQIMSFAVFATVVFFLTTYLSLVGKDNFVDLLYALVFIGLGAYLYGRWGTIVTPQRKRWIVGFGLAGVVTALGVGLFLTNTEKQAPTFTDSTFGKDGELQWQEWFPGKMELTRKKKRIAWIDYTADW